VRTPQCASHKSLTLPSQATGSSWERSPACSKYTCWPDVKLHNLPVSRYTTSRFGACLQQSKHLDNESRDIHHGFCKPPCCGCPFNGQIPEALSLSPDLLGTPGIISNVAGGHRKSVTPCSTKHAPIYQNMVRLLLYVAQRTLRLGNSKWFSLIH